MNTKIHVSLDGCCSLHPSTLQYRLLDIGEEGMTLFNCWLQSCGLAGGSTYEPDITVLGVFCDYLEEKVEPFDLRDLALKWYRHRMTER